jgi:hypothetical protein
MEPNFRTVTLKELDERRRAKLRGLQDSGMTAEEAEAVLERRTKKFQDYWEAHPDFVEAADVLLFEQKFKFAFHSCGAVATSFAVGSNLLLNRITKSKFSALPRHYRLPVRIGLIVAPFALWWEYIEHESKRIKRLIEDKYGERAAAL